MSRILKEGTKVYAMDSLEDFGKYLVDKYGGKLIKHTSRIWIYEDKYGKRHALRIADESVTLEPKQYYKDYNCQDVIVGVRRSEDRCAKHNSGYPALYVGQIDVAAIGKKKIVTVKDLKQFAVKA